MAPFFVAQSGHFKKIATLDALKVAIDIFTISALPN
jgi:hypothetical protein